MLDWLRRLLAQPACAHCWHWLFTTKSGTMIYRSCCHCGRVSATQVILESDSPRRVTEHGAYIEWHTERDRTVVVPLRPRRERGSVDS